MQKGETSGELRLFLNSIPSSFTRRNYKVYLDKYLKTVGVKDGTELLSKSTKEIEDQLIEFIISLKEQGCKSTTIVNYVRPVVGICQLMDKFLNVNKIRRLIPPKVRNKKTRGYEIPEIQRMLDIADERMRVIILTLSSSGMRLNGLTGLTLRNLKSVNNDTMYQITVYENEPEEYVTFCSSECRAKGIDPYLDMRRRYGEDINDNSPLIREQFDKRDPFAAAHPKPITDIAISLKIMGLAETTGLRTRTQLEKGQKGASQRKEIPLTNGFRRYFSTTLLIQKKCHPNIGS